MLYQSRDEAGGGPTQAVSRFALAKPARIQSPLEMKAGIVPVAGSRSLLKDAANVLGLDYQSKVLEEFAPYVGKTIEDIEGEIPFSDPSTNTAWVANGIRSIIGVGPYSVEKLEKVGIEVKTTPILKSTMRPAEGMSFPAFKAQDLIKETWTNSRLFGLLDGLLIIPIFHTKKRQPQGFRRLGQPLFWSPNDEQWASVEEEWTMYREAFKRGDAKVIYDSCWRKSHKLKKQNSTNVIHVRPHGRDADDTDTDSLGNSFTKRAFWLNMDFVRDVMLAQSHQ